MNDAVRQAREQAAEKFCRGMQEDPGRHLVVTDGLGLRYIDGDEVSQAVANMLDRCAATQYRLVVVHCCKHHWATAVAVATLSGATLLAYSPEGPAGVYLVNVYLVKRTEESLRAVLGAVCAPEFRAETLRAAAFDPAAPWQVVKDASLDVTPAASAWLDQNLVPYLDARLAAGRV
jgi:hypothetical protein